MLKAVVTKKIHRCDLAVKEYTVDGQLQCSVARDVLGLRRVS